MTRVTLSVLAASTLLALVPALARAQSRSTEPATVYADGADSAGDFGPPADSWRRDAESGLRLRLRVEEGAVAAENARRDDEAGDVGTYGLVGMISGIAGLVGGGLMFWTGALLALAGSFDRGGGGSSGVALVIAGGACAGVGALALITGGILFSQRARHIEPGEVSLALGPGSLALTAAF